MAAVFLQQSHSRGRYEKLTNCVSGCDFTTPLFISTDRLFQSDSKVSLQASFIAISCYFFQTVIFFLLHWFVGLEASSGWFFLLLFPLRSKYCRDRIKILNFFIFVRVGVCTKQTCHQEIALFRSIPPDAHRVAAPSQCSECSVTLSNSLNYAIWHKAHLTGLKASISLSASPN